MRPEKEFEISGTKEDVQVHVPHAGRPHKRGSAGRRKNNIDDVRLTQSIGICRRTTRPPMLLHSRAAVADVRWGSLKACGTRRGEPSRRTG